MGSKKILVVDDEEGTLTLMNKKLSEYGFEIIEAKTGEEAVKKARKHNPDLILMDLMLPDFDGAETVKKIHEMPPTKDTKVVFLSSIASKGDDEIKGAAKIKVGDEHYEIFAKPVDFEELIQEIEKNLNEA